MPTGRKLPGDPQRKVSCVGCRKKRLKCDRQTPGSPCVRCLSNGNECRRPERTFKFHPIDKPFGKRQKWVKTPRRLIFIDESKQDVGSESSHDSWDDDSDEESTMSLTAEQEPKHTPTSPIDGGNTFGAALPLRARGEETALYHKRPSQNYPRPSGLTNSLLVTPIPSAYTPELFTLPPSHTNDLSNNFISTTETESPTASADHLNGWALASSVPTANFYPLWPSQLQYTQPFADEQRLTIKFGDTTYSTHGAEGHICCYGDHGSGQHSNQVVWKSEREESTLLGQQY